MKPAVFKILASIFLLALTASCSKSDSSSGTPAKSKTVLMTQASWKVQSVALDTDKNGVPDPGSDLTSNIQSCQLDNTYTFKTDNTGITDEAATKCNSTDPQTTPFTWSFKNSETVLNGSFTFIKGDAMIITLNDTNLVVTYDDNFGTSTSYHLIATLKH